VSATGGQVVVYRGKPFKAYFSAICGGFTASGQQVFGDPSPALRSVTCGYCGSAPKLNWSLKLPLLEARQKLGVADLVAMAVYGTGLDGRVDQVILYRANNTTVSMAATTMRDRLGPQNMQSTRFTVRAEGPNFILEGRGWGHGVGLCQWGAKGMADAGKTCKEILERYYPGANVVKEY
jgi:stage II sporulation protein D